MELQRVCGLSAVLFLVDFNLDFDFELDDEERGWSSEYDRNFFDFRGFTVSDLLDLVALDFADLVECVFVDFEVLVDFEDLDESETGPLESDFAATTLDDVATGSPYFAASFKRFASRFSSFLDFLSSRCSFFNLLCSSLIFFSLARNVLIVGSMSKTAIFSRISFRRTNTPRCGGHRKYRFPMTAPLCLVLISSL